MSQFNLYEAKAKLSALVEKATRGEEVVIAKAGKPCVRLVPVSGTGLERRPGKGKGRVRILADFDDELPLELANALGMAPGKKRT